MGQRELHRIRVLLICTHFPPTNATGARRPYYLAKTLLELGFDVLVLTSAKELPDPWDADLEGMEVLRLPVTPIPDGLNSIQRGSAYLYWRLMGHSYHLVPRTIAFFFLPLDFSSRMDFDERFVAARFTRADIVVSTGPGWSTFEFGHRISTYWGCPFLVDYRDPWNAVIPGVGLRTVTWYGDGLIGWLKRLRMRRLERRYTSRAAGITAATEAFLENALRSVGHHPSRVIHNGFNTIPTNIAVIYFPKLTFLYTGRLYHEQEWDIVLEALNYIFAIDPVAAQEIQLLLVGPTSEAPELLMKLKECADRTGMVRMMGRVGRDEALELQRSADALLHVGFKGKRGILPLKFIEFLNAGKPILQVSTGSDVQERILKETETGTVHPTAASLADKLMEYRSIWASGKAIPHSPNVEALDVYSWKNQMSGWVDFIRDTLEEEKRKNR